MELLNLNSTLEIEVNSVLREQRCIPCTHSLPCDPDTITKQRFTMFTLLHQTMDAAAGRLDTLVLKLRHPLTTIRHRALQTLRFKLREHLIGWKELEPLHKAFVPSLLTCLEPPLELEALHVLELLLQTRSDTLIACLQLAGAAQKLHRAAEQQHPELQTTYDKLIRQLYVTKRVPTPPCPDTKQRPKVQIKPSNDKVAPSTVLFPPHQAPQVHDVEAKGWRFPSVPLASLDAQQLFEFQVKCHVQRTVAETVTNCATFRTDLLRTLPPPVFLERPATYLYLLQLVQEPLLVDEPRSLALGVNYFNDLGDKTFASKRDYLIGTRVLAGLRAMEAFVLALHETPRTGHARVRQLVSHDNEPVAGFSFSGAIYRLFHTLLPLLRSPRHPRLHLLNLLLVTVASLPEPLDATDTEDTWTLNHQRLEHILRRVSDIGRPETLAMTPCLMWKLVELVFRLLTLYPASHYVVERAETVADTRAIRIPSTVWHAVTEWMAHPAFPELITHEWHHLATIQDAVQQLDTTLAARAQGRHAAVQDVRDMLDLIHHASADGDKSEAGSDPTMQLETARKLLLARSVWRHVDAPVLARAVLRPIHATLVHASTVTDTALNIIRAILSSLVLQAPCTVRDDIFHGVVTILDKLVDGHARVDVVTRVVVDHELLTLLLLVGATNANAPPFLWALVRHAVTLSTTQHEPFVPLVPFLQHFAYMEPSPTSSCPIQPELVAFVDQLHQHVPDTERVLLHCRGLLHVSSDVRTAAAVALQRRVTTESFAHLPLDPFHDDAPSFQAALLKTPLPSLPPPSTRPERDVAPHVATFVQLERLVSVQTSAFPRAAAWKQLRVFLDHACVQVWTALDELQHLAHVVEQLEASLDKSAQVEDVLLVFRTLVFRSLPLRAALRRKAATWQRLVAFIFHPSVAIRAVMYYIVLLVTCSSDMFVPEAGTEVHAHAPSFLHATFGLYATHWRRCGIVTNTLDDSFETYAARVRPETTWLDDIRAVRTANMQDKSTTDVRTLLRAEHTRVVDSVRHATSHAKCLNAVYHLLMLCTAWRFARTQFVDDWERLYDRYFGVCPQSARDYVILGALVALLSSLFRWLPRSGQVRALMLLKSRMLPLLPRSSSRHFALQVARLLLQMSAAKIHDVFLSLAADTNLLANICTQYATDTTDAMLQTLMLQVVLRFAQALTEPSAARLSTSSRETIGKRLVDMLAPLLTIVNRPRVPHSYQDRDAYQVAAQCLGQIWKQDALLSKDCVLEHTDRHVLLDGSWATRLVLDHEAPMRALGFHVIEQATRSIHPSAEILEKACTSLFDSNEADAVRAAAASLLTTVFTHSSQRSPDDLPTLVQVCDGVHFGKRVVAMLVAWVQCTDTVPLETCTACLSLVRRLYLERDHFASSFGDVKHDLDTHDMLERLTQTLSFRAWHEHCTHTGRSSLCPSICHLLTQLLQLLQAICHQAQGDQVLFLVQQTPLLRHLTALVTDIAAFDDVEEAVETMPQQYALLEHCARTLSLACVQMVATPRPSVPDDSTNPACVHFIQAITRLLAPRHPIAFRTAIARLVPCLHLLLPTWLSCSDDALVSALYDLYVHAADPRASNLSSLVDLERVAWALTLLLETKPSFQALLREHDVIQWSLACIQHLFHALQVAHQGHKAKDVLPLVRRLQALFLPLRALVAGDADNQRLARTSGLVTVLVSNWHLLEMAPPLLERALELVANFTYANEASRQSLVDSSVKNAPTLLSLVVAVVAARPSPAAAIAACHVLQSELLHPEAVLAVQKGGHVAKWMATLDLRRHDQRDIPYVVQMLHVLCNVAAQDAGAHVLLKTGPTRVRDFLDDGLRSSSVEIQRATSLLLRNLALASTATHYVALFDQLLTLMLDICLDGTHDVVTRQHVATAVWSLVYDHPQARAVVKASRLATSLTALQHGALVDVHRNVHCPAWTHVSRDGMIANGLDARPGLVFRRVATNGRRWSMTDIGDTLTTMEAPHDHVGAASESSSSVLEALSNAGESKSGNGGSSSLVGVVSNRSSTCLCSY
ncbi:hypothetical protein PsorP6_000896 [Peronosclerospora sorghi]|uniref:Uncharacterized protein n=1 Tax=Peronosclerospora sorghi TaxID=230839 RepID=A0ACC0WW12_9STRA|nr:hypothetical protein PsorP6_000896 [Peronosclerospora sorghi]